jgi:glycosyltransferase involved in cell wall biosynthesis
MRRGRYHVIGLHSEPIDTLFFLSAPTFGLGPQGRILRLAKGWAARGHPTAVCALQGDVAPGPRELAQGVPIERLTRHGVEVLKSHRLDAALAVRRCVAERRPRLVFALETLVDYHVKLGLIGRSEPLVTLLGIDRWKWERKRLRRSLMRRLAPRSNAIIGNSRACLAGFRRAVGADIFDAIPSAVVHNPVDPGEIEPTYARPAPERFVVGALGRLAEQKGFDLLIAAWARLPERVAGRALELVIQGSGPDQAALAAEIARLGLGARVRLRPHGPVAPFLAELHALAAPSRWAGFENAVLEAAMAGLPCLITRATGLAELADTRQLAFVEPTAEAFAAAIAGLAASPDEQRAERARAQRASLVAQLSLDVIAAELDARLHELGALS